MSEIERLKAEAEALQAEYRAKYKAELEKLKPLLDKWQEAEKRWEDAMREAGQIYVLHYWRYHSKFTEEFFDLDEALRRAEYAEDAGDMSAEKVTGPNGFVLEGDAFRDAMWDSHK